MSDDQHAPARVDQAEAILQHSPGMRGVRWGRLLWLVPAALVLVLLWLVGSALMRHRNERAAAERVAELGGTCEWETRELPWPFPLLGKEWATVRVRLRTIDLGGTSAGDEDLALIGDLDGLRFLDVGKTRVTDAGLVHIAKLAGLWELFLYNTQITDAGLMHLSKLTSLQGLWLMKGQVTDAGVAALKEALPGLTVFR